MNLLIDTFLNILKEGFFLFFSDAMNSYSLSNLLLPRNVIVCALSKSALEIPDCSLFVD